MRPDVMSVLTKVTVAEDAGRVGYPALLDDRPPPVPTTIFLMDGFFLVKPSEPAPSRPRGSWFRGHKVPARPLLDQGLCRSCCSIFSRESTPTIVNGMGETPSTPPGLLRRHTYSILSEELQVPSAG